MKKILSILFVLMLIPSVLALTASGDEEVVKTMSLSKMVVETIPTKIPDLDCNEAIKPVFAVDVSQGQDTQDAEPFMQRLISEGYYVAKIDISTAKGVNDLKCVNVLYVTSIRHNGEINNNYPTADINTIYDYVVNGGGLLYTSDWGGFASKTKDLAEKFGIYVDSNSVTDYDDYDTSYYWPLYNTDNFVTTSPIFKDVKGHVQLAGTSFLVKNTPLIPIVRSDLDASPGNAPVAAAGFYKDGCVVTTGDSNWLHTYPAADGFNRHDNPQLAVNMVDFLVKCNPEDVEDPGNDNLVPEFGIISAFMILIGAGMVVFRKRK